MQPRPSGSIRLARFEHYITENIHFGLDKENLSGLELYFEMAAAAGLIPRAKPLEFASATAHSTARRGA